MSIKLIVFLVIGTAAMSVPILVMSEKYQIVKWKVFLVTILLTISGTAGTYLMYYLENREIGGLSFYGAMFLVPVIFLMVAPILRIPYSKVMDFCAVGECIMLALMKAHCIIGGCCLGRILFTLSDGSVIRFPSRLIEMIVAIILFIILFRWSAMGEKCGKLYIWYMLLYGSTRFVLNIFREAWAIKEMLLPYGNIWSLVAVLIGVLCLIKDRSTLEKQNHD